MRGGTQMPWYTCVGQKTTSGASPHLLPYLRQGHLWFAAAYVRPAGPWAAASLGSPVPTSHLLEVWGSACYHAQP